ncbi:hypothetical protein F511_41189 [Dorcoceras hygrometricum]|uniref:Dystroglycan-like n=1 Tax=Dorcoceras hygrometricum TaxID=472368 RepID=A0A2Z7AAC3_9LAMI|nr:hypothetical protein F511_41189 [Dorcoceras hygrometricum]
MASSFYSNAQHVDFESVVSMDDHGMVSMFEALMASGLRGFLGCPAVVYEDALVDFFENSSVRSGVIISTVGGQLVEISEERFAESFELPVDGLGDLLEIPKDAIFDAQSIVSLSGEPISLSGRKNQMKIPFRLLCVSKKRPAADVGAAVPKKKRTFKKKSISSISSLELVEVAEEAIPIQQVAEPSADDVDVIIQQVLVETRAADAPADTAQPALVEVAEEAIPIQQVAEPSADDVDVIIQQVLVETRAADAPADTAQPAVTEEKLWFDLPYDDLVKQWEAERPVVTASDTEECIATVDVAPADGDQQVQEFVAPISAEDTLSADEKMSLDDILLTIPVDIPLPSSCMEISKITMGKSIKIPGVSKWTWFLKSLPRIPAEDKGKEVLLEKDPVKGNPAEEHYSLICADIELLVSLRAQVIDEVATFFHSFSLKKLATINFEEMYWKEEQVLSWGETESPQEAIQRKFYILLKYRTVLVWKFLEAWRANFVPGQGSSAVDIQVIELISDLYLSFLEELAKEEQAHNLIWNKPCCSKIFEGSPRDRGAVIARTNSNTRSPCWIRKMILVDGLWTVELYADKWVKIPRKVISTEVPRQRQFDDTLPSMSVFFRLMRKRWADVCLEVVEFCATKRLLPVGSTQFCRSLQLVEPVSNFASSRSSVFALRVSQFCSLSHSSGDRFIYSGISAVGVFVRFQQMVCDQQLNSLSSSADRFFKSNQQILLSRSEGATTQPTITRQCGIQARRLSRPPHQNSVGPLRHDESAVQSQRAKEFSSQRNQAKYSTTQLSTKLKMERNQLPKTSKEQKNYGSTIMKIHEHCNKFMLLKSDDASLQTAVEMLSAVEREIFVRVLHQSMSDRISCWYFSRCVLVGISSNAYVDFIRWCFSCDGQQRALRDSEATMFCEQEPAVGFSRVFLSGYRNYVV